MGKRLTTKQFIQKAKKVHGETFGYSKVEYVNNKTKVVITCKTHGEFLKTPDKYINNKQICPKCVVEFQSEKNRSDISEVIDKFKKRHSNKYDYSLVDYKNARTKVKIICPTHGQFEQIPNNHLKHGCKRCGRDSLRLLEINLKKLYFKIRSNISGSISKKGFTKKSKTSEILGCTWKEFKIHLEDNPYGFKIGDENLDLDHIIPISSAKTEEEVYKLNHYSNFQLLPFDYNRWVKGCKLFNREHFNAWIEKNKKEICQEY